MTFISVILTIAFGFAHIAVAQVPKPGGTPKQKKAYKLTPEEQKIVKDARATFKKEAKAPPPSQHMRDKMQSGVGE